MRATTLSRKKRKRNLTKTQAVEFSTARGDSARNRSAHFQVQQAEFEEPKTVKSESPFKSESSFNSHSSRSSPTLPCRPVFRHQPEHESVGQAVFYPISANGLLSAPVAWFSPSAISGSASPHTGHHVSLNPSNEPPVPSSSSSSSLGKAAEVPVSYGNLPANVSSNNYSYQAGPANGGQHTPNGDCPSYTTSSSACTPRRSSLALLSSPNRNPVSNNAREHHQTKVIGTGSPVHVDKQRVPFANPDAAGSHANTSPDNLRSLNAFSLSSPPEVSATGRLSNDAEKSLTNAFAELDCVIQKARAITGLSSKQIIKRWQPSNSRSSNLWNIYQKYFQTRPEEELNRLQGKGKRTGSAKACMKSIRASYQAFQEAEPNFKSILEMFRRIHDIDGSNTTVNGRWREFLKYVNTMKRLAESASTVNGFEIAFCAVGSVVQQDQSLSATYCSPMVESFFSDRLRLSDNEIEGHLKAHAYDHTSRAALSSGNNESGTLSPLASGKLSTEATTSQGDEALSKIKGQKRRLLKVLKDKIMKLVGPCKISQLRSSHLPFSDIPKILAQNGWVVENWPEDVPFPCDLQKGKGIASLRAEYRDSLIRACGDCLYPVKVVKKYSEAVPSSEPVVIGIPPPPGSEHARGRRRFLDEGQTSDRNGPARRTDPAKMGYKGGEGSGTIESGIKRPEPCDGQKVDQVHPKKRRSK